MSQDTDDETRRASSAEALAHALELLTTRLRSLARDDAEIAHACDLVGRWLLDAGRSNASGEDAAHAPRPTELTPPPNAAGGDAASEATDPDAATKDLPDETTVERLLTIGGESLLVTVPDHGALEHVEDEEPDANARASRGRPARTPSPPATVAERSRLKQRCCLWAIERRRLLMEGADFDRAIKPTDVTLGQRVRSLPDCYAWSLAPHAQLPSDDALRDAAGCYRALAEALEFAVRVREDDEAFASHGQPAYELLAACCSALLKILKDCGIARDRDQEDAFAWLRTRTEEDRIFIRRHMRLDDPAAPDAWVLRREQIREIERDIAASHAFAKETRNLLGRVAYIAERWADGDEDDQRRQAHKLDAAITRLAELGVRTSDPRIRDPLARIMDDLPAAFEPDAAFSEALRYADEHAARVEIPTRRDDASAPAPTEAVLHARELLADKVVVMIGGTCRPLSRDALCEGLGLRELRWITTRAHEPVDHFDAQVRKPEVALVILAIRWSSHSFAEIKADCAAAGKPLVRLPRGYGLNQVAKEIVTQASQALSRV